MNTSVQQSSTKGREIRSFLFLAIFLAPALAVAIVGSLGLVIWIFQIVAGPPGPPAL